MLSHLAVDSLRTPLRTAGTAGGVPSFCLLPGPPRTGLLGRRRRQQLDDLFMSVVCGKLQGGFTVAIPQSRIGTVLEQQSDDFDIALGGREHQGRPALLVVGQVDAMPALSSLLTTPGFSPLEA